MTRQPRLSNEKIDEITNRIARVLEAWAIENHITEGRVFHLNASVSFTKRGADVIGDSMVTLGPRPMPSDTDEP